LLENSLLTEVLIFSQGEGEGVKGKNNKPGKLRLKELHDFPSTLCLGSFPLHLMCLSFLTEAGGLDGVFKILCPKLL
jgi:hypothetical protein